MEITADSLRDSYAVKSDDELLDLYSTGTLTEMAYEILESEIKGRGITMPKRSHVQDVQHKRPQSLEAHFKGQASLISAYWLIGVFGGLLFSFILNLLVSSPTAFFMFLLFAWLPYVVFANVSIWRCAWNTKWKGWGYLARTSVIATIIKMILFTFAIAREVLI